MTIEMAIDRADRLRPNQFTNTEKVRWLSELDNQVFYEVLLMAAENWKPKTITQDITDEQGNVIETKEIIDPINMEPAITYEGYNEETPLDTPLLIDDIYGNTYVDYLISKYDYNNREFEAYNASSSIFNNQYQNYCIWYRKNHMPKQGKVRGI